MRLAAHLTSFFFFLVPEATQSQDEIRPFEGRPAVPAEMALQGSKTETMDLVAGWKEKNIPH